MVTASIDTGACTGLQLQVVASDTSDFLSLDNVKSFLRVDFADDDYWLQILLSGAIDLVESYCGISVRPKTFIATYLTVSSSFELPYGPNQVITSMVDSAGNVLAYTTLGTVYPQVRITTFTGADSITIGYTAGYLPGTVPSGIIQAIAKMVNTNFDIRADLTVERATLIEFSNDSKSLLAPYRRTIGWW